MNKIEWLSEGGEKLFAEIDDAGPGKPLFDIVIVGSGYGGAVAAARLAGLTGPNGPLKVCVLERGREFIPGMFPEKLSDLPGQMRIQGDDVPEPRGVLDGLFDLRLGSDVSTLLGNGLGGGSLINAGVMVKPDEGFFKEGWPAEIAEADLTGCFKSAWDMLDPNRTPLKTDKLNALGVLADAIGDKTADRRAEVAVSFTKKTSQGGVDQEACIHCGDCFTGCNHRAKNTLAMNYLPLARQRRARLFTGVTVLEVAPTQAGVWQLKLELTESTACQRYRRSKVGKGVHENKAPAPILNARRVVLAAGTFGSTEILMRSPLPRSKQLGQRFSTNGDMIAIGYKTVPNVNASADPNIAPDKRQVGPTISGIIDRRKSSGILIEEMAIPAALRRLFEEVITTFGGLYSLMRWNDAPHSPGDRCNDPAAIDPVAVGKTAVYATMGDDEAKGCLEPLVSKDQPKATDRGLRVHWPEVAKQKVFARAVKILESGHAHPNMGGDVVPYPGWRALPKQIESIFGNPSGQGSIFTVHPLGGCAMGNSFADGVVNYLGQVFHQDGVHEGLVVLDGSIMPRALGINPCWTIAVLAEHAIEKLKVVWNLSAPALPALDGLPPVPMIPPPVRAQRKHTAIRIAERMMGNGLTFPLLQEKIDGHLELEFAGIGDLTHWTSNLPRPVSIPTGRLTLTRNDKPVGSVALCGEMSLLERERSSACERARRALWAWFRNRGLREIWITIAEKLSLVPLGGSGTRARDQKPSSLWKQVRALLALASHAGEARRFVYRLRTVEDLSIDGKVMLPRNSELLGEKRIAYVYLGNPWTQLTRMQLSLQDSQKGLRNLGMVELDPMHFVKDHAVQLQFLDQASQPDAMADFASLMLFLARVVGVIHLWTFRAPDYPSPYRNHTFKKGYVWDESRKPAKVTGAKKTGPMPLPVPRSIRIPIVIYDKTINIEIPLDTSPRNEVGDNAGDGLPVWLTRYTPAGGGEKGPVALFHGYGAGGNTFAPPGATQSLVKHLVDEGYDAWVVDFRTSIALESSLQDWIFENIAYGDVPIAIQHVFNVTGKRVNVVAHCVGAAMFSMAVLAGRVDRDWINAAVLSQVGPLVQLPPLNRTRGYVTRYLRYLLRWSRLDVAAPLTAMVRLIDRLLAAYPYPDREIGVHHSTVPWVKFTDEAYCNRTHAIFGRLFEHKNLDENMLRQLDLVLGHVNTRTFLQTTFYATKGRITDYLGRNTYVTYENVAKQFDFPVCMIHGKLNDVFSARGTDRTYQLLSATFEATEAQLKKIPIESFGHQDCLIGAEAHTHVFPEISKFLDANANAPRLTAKELVRDIVREPLLGPVVGWVRHASSGLDVNLMFVPDDTRSPPIYALSILMQAQQGNSPPIPVPGHAVFHELELITPGLAADLSVNEAATGRGVTRKWPTVAAQTIKVKLPAHTDDYFVLVLTVHREPHGSEEGRGKTREIQYDDKKTRLPNDKEVKYGELTDEQFELYIPAILHECTDLRDSAMKFCQDSRVIDDDYEVMPGVAVLSNTCLSVAGPEEAQSPEAEPAKKVAEKFTFAMGSCRYAASIFDRELADRSFGNLMALLQSTPAGRNAPQMLLLTGDQIYADATAGLFDPTTGLERFDHRYLEAWSAPHAREVLRRLPTYMMLDDHELEENWEKSAAFERDGKSAFAHYQRKLAPPNPSKIKPLPFWYSFSSGGYGFFVADTRSDRTRAAQADRLADEMIDRVQMDALQRWLLQQNKVDDGRRPKFVVSSAVMAPWNRESRGSPAYALREDNWTGFPSSMNKLLSFIAMNEITNVVFLSGDYHCSMACRMGLRVCAGKTVQAWSIVSSGFYAPYPFANTRPEDLELCYRGKQSDWLGISPPSGWKDLEIDYCTLGMTCDDGFAVLDVAASYSGGWRLDVEFNGGAGRLVRRSISL